MKFHRADATTIHYYAQSFGIPARNATWFASYFIGDRCRMARACSRPCILEEVGELPGFFTDRSVALRLYSQYAWYHGAQVVLFWQVWRLTSSDTSDSSAQPHSCGPNP